MNNIQYIPIAPLPSQQQGITLIIGLIMLLLLTILGTTAMVSSSTQHKMSGSIRDLDVSFQSAESGLENGESWLAAQFLEPVASPTCTGQCVYSNDNELYYEDKDEAWWQANGAQLSAGTISGVHAQPYYHLQYISFKSDDLTIGHGVGSGKHYYYVTSQATGGNELTSSVLQTTFARRF